MVVGVEVQVNWPKGMSVGELALSSVCLNG